MEMKMKRLLAAGALLQLFSGAYAQEVSYALPCTSFLVEIDAVQEVHFAGPYAAYAKELLNLDVTLSDTKNTYIKEIRILPRVEADPVAPRYTCPQMSPTMMAMSSQGLIAFSSAAESAEVVWRFQPSVRGDFGTSGISSKDRKENHITYRTVKTDTADVRYPVEHTVSVAKTLADKAEEAAEAILNARTERMNIAIGNTDASYSGESMAAALAELTKVEEEYLLMFTGYSVKAPIHASFEVMPSSTARTNRYTAFYLTEDGKFQKENKARARPFELEITPVSIPDVKTSDTLSDTRKKSDKAYTIHYRLPAVCRMRLLEDGLPVVESRVPVYQLGRECEMPVNQ